METRISQPLTTVYEIAVTGTQEGMTRGQEWTLIGLWLPLAQNPLDHLVVKLHHGDCVGVDSEANEIARELGFKTEAWPYEREDRINKKRAFSQVDVCNLPTADPMERNYKIALAGKDGLYALPKEMDEVVRSGTWSTVRRARKLERKIWIIRPDGSVKEEG